MTAPARPAWLPDHIPFTGDWDGFVRTLYAIFESDFKHSAPRFRSLPVWYDRRIESGDRYQFEEGFWHLVTKDAWVYNRATRRKEKERLPDFDRAGRLPWAKPIIVNSHEGAVVDWDYEDETARGKVVRSYLWLKAFDFVVILERQTARDRFYLQAYHLLPRLLRGETQGLGEPICPTNSECTPLKWLNPP